MQTSNNIKEYLWIDYSLINSHPQKGLIKNINSQESSINHLEQLNESTSTLGKRKKTSNLGKRKKIGEQKLFSSAKKLASTTNASCEKEVSLHLFFDECIQESRELFKQNLNFITNEFSFLTQEPLPTPELTPLPCSTLIQQASLITPLTTETTCPSLSLIFDDFKLVNQIVISNLPNIAKSIFLKRKFSSFYKRSIKQIANRYRVDEKLVIRIDKYARKVHTVFNPQKHTLFLEQSLENILAANGENYQKIDRIFRFIIYDFNANITQESIQHVSGHDLLQILNHHYLENVEKICKKNNFSKEHWLNKAQEFYPKDDLKNSHV